MPKKNPEDRDNCQKIKLLKLMELLRQETDEDNSLTTGEICEKLTAMGISCERRTVPKDMATLKKFGYEVMQEKIGHDNHFWVADRNFSLPELKILMDAVQAASFIPQEKTDALILKIAALGGSHQKELLTENSVRFNIRKHSNTQIFYTVEAIEKAIREKAKLSFRYYDLNENHEKVFRKDGERYIVEPISLVYTDDNYYLLTYNAKYEATTTYRVDRMANVKCEEESVSNKSPIWNIDVAEDASQAFKMYHGEEREITLRFENGLMNSVYDRFGEDITITRVDDNTCRTTVKVQLSRIFWGWFFSMSEQMIIEEPMELQALYEEEIKSRMSTWLRIASRNNMQ